MTQSFGLPPTPFGPMPVASMAARMQRETLSPGPYCEKIHNIDIAALAMQLHPQATGFNNPAAFHRSGMRPYGFEPPDSPEWGQPSVPPPPMPGSYVRSMSDAFAATSQGGNVHYNHPPPQGIHGKPPRQQNGLFDPARSGAQRKQQRKGGFWTKTFNLNVRSERRHAPPPGIDVTYAKPAAPEMFQSSARQFTPEPSYDYDEPSSASSVEEITSDEDNDDDDGSRPANPFLFAPKRSSLKRSAGPTHPQDDEWRSWHLPNVALEGMKKIKTLGEGSSGTVRCVKILNSPTSPELVGQVTALKTMRSEATESGAIEVAADKAIDKLASSPHSDDRTVFWASQHIARLVAKSIGHSDVPPSLHTEYCEGGVCSFPPFCHNHIN